MYVKLAFGFLNLKLAHFGSWDVLYFLWLGLDGNLGGFEAKLGE